MSTVTLIGPEKPAHVVNIATEATQVANAEAGRVVIDPSAKQTTAETAISTVVQVTKMVEAAHENLTAWAPAAVMCQRRATP
jgi:hypothetical protein